MKKLKTYKQLFEINKNSVDFRSKLIELIKNSVYCSKEQMYSAGDLEVESDPVYYEKDGEIALIDRYYHNEVEYTIYGDYKQENEVGTGYIKYEDLDTDILKEIWHIIESGLRYDLIEIDLEVTNQDYYEKLIIVLMSGGVRDYKIYPKKYEDYILYKNLNNFGI